jgi:threonylcarbamoyladenosine tRNA methylthiotransferase MtaB
MPVAAIGADVMTGFPGETDFEFEETRRMIEDLPFTYLHVFTYSARPGTPAATMRDQVPVQIARERNHILREMAAKKKLAFMRSFVGRTLEAISLNVACEDSSGTWTEALTDNYLKLRLRGKHEPNRWINARVEAVDNGQMTGRLSAVEDPNREVACEYGPGRIPGAQDQEPASGGERGLGQAAINFASRKRHQWSDKYAKSG